MKLVEEIVKGTKTEKYEDKIKDIPFGDTVASSEKKTEGKKSDEKKTDDKKSDK